MTKTDRRLRNYIFEKWFYPPPEKWWQFQLPLPGYCRFVSFTDDEIEQMRKEHDR